MLLVRHEGVRCKDKDVVREQAITRSRLIDIADEDHRILQKLGQRRSSHHMKARWHKSSRLPEQLPRRVD
jgi:hypothetical protein